MSFKFSLCPTCLNHFRALEFNAAAHRGSNLIPFNSLCWEDELTSKHEGRTLRAPKVDVVCLNQSIHARPHAVQ
jgi:hypothetical protein